MDWNVLSLVFDREVSKLSKIERRGDYLIPLFLDHMLVDSCSKEVQDAFLRALVRFFREEENGRVSCDHPREVS
jgi:hypothetical protein